MEEALVINWGYVILLFVVGAITYHRKALDLLGSLFMIFMGVIIVFSAGVSWLLLILLFLILSLISTRWKKQYKHSLGIYEGRRTAKNVISNGIVAFIMAAFGGYYLPFVGGFIGAVATATADTMASEIGVIQEPRLISSMKKVAPGTDGAISVLGTAFGIVGAGLIGFAAFLLGIIHDPLLSLRIAVISGTIGCFMDSFLGAVLERRDFINNEHVNLLATVTGAIIGILSTI
ncbi:hypothetical protein MBCUT_12610 [Methanobrevibacter cuticularis]|uniref:TIGR00297 family protein n=1 Tax=Methanobrevibacter cuticularis TaxID=47311 RepID=A0A166DMH7_9EURY|nr:TIGR00297 family protein [Methanobrevibacter cuticularis]KZX15758.1 hypothetical protein MBCUT_12610 [Methanobrevibacter cuticularis]